MQESLDALGVNWPQLVANLAGFAVFLWLMTKFAWEPISNFMQKRKEDIETKYAQIESENRELEEQRAKLNREKQEFQETATQRRQQAIREAEQEKQLILERARQEAQEIKDKAAMDRERILEEARLEVRNYIVNVGVEAGMKASLEVLDKETHRRLVERIVEKLESVR